MRGVAASAPTITRASASALEELAPRFDAHRELRACLDAVLEGRLGALWRCGEALRADVGCYAFFAGDAGDPGATALLRGVERPRELLVAAEPGWRAAAGEAWAGVIRDRPMRAMDPAALDVDALDALAARLPSGYALESFDESLARQLDEALRPHALAVFPSAKDFAARGIGRAAVHDGEVACAATSYTITATAIELAISTRERHRGRGLATATAAALAAACLRQGLTPQWNAANDTSVHVAERLGYRAPHPIEILYVPTA